MTDLTEHEQAMMEWMAGVLESALQSIDAYPECYHRERIATRIILAAREKELMVGVPYRADEEMVNNGNGHPDELAHNFSAMTARFRAPRGITPNIKRAVGLGAENAREEITT